MHDGVACVCLCTVGQHPAEVGGVQGAQHGRRQQQDAAAHAPSLTPAGDEDRSQIPLQGKSMTAGEQPAFAAAERSCLPGVGCVRGIVRGIVCWTGRS